MVSPTASLDLTLHDLVRSNSMSDSWLIKKRPPWVMGDDNGASVHSGVNEYEAIDRLYLQLYLDYP